MVVRTCGGNTFQLAEWCSVGSKEKMEIIFLSYDAVASTAAAADEMQNVLFAGGLLLSARLVQNCLPLKERISGNDLGGYTNL